MSAPTYTYVRVRLAITIRLGDPRARTLPIRFTLEHARLLAARLVGREHTRPTIPVVRVALQPAVAP